MSGNRSPVGPAADALHPAGGWTSWWTSVTSSYWPSAAKRPGKWVTVEARGTW